VNCARDATYSVIVAERGKRILRCDIKTRPKRKPLIFLGRGEVIPERFSLFSLALAAEVRWESDGPGRKEINAVQYCYRTLRRSHPIVFSPPNRHKCTTTAKILSDDNIIRHEVFNELFSYIYNTYLKSIYIHTRSCNI